MATRNKNTWFKKISGWIQDPLSLFREKSSKKKVARKIQPKAKPKKAAPKKLAKRAVKKPIPKKIKKTVKPKKPKPIAKKKIKPRLTSEVGRGRKSKPILTSEVGRGLPSSEVKSGTKPVKNKSPGILVGKITHYFSKAGACAIKVENTELKEGAKILIKGESTDFKMVVKSIQINRIPVPSGKPGEDIGIGVSKPVEPGDLVYLLTN